MNGAFRDNAVLPVLRGFYALAYRKLPAWGGGRGGLFFVVDGGKLTHTHTHTHTQSLWVLSALCFRSDRVDGIQYELYIHC